MRKIKLITISLIFSVMLGIAPVTIAANSDIIATPTTHLLSFDGSLVDVVAAFTINNENYFKLRDIALLVNSFDVTYDSEKSAISIISDVPYTPNGTESTAKPSGYTTIAPSTDKVYIGETALDLTAYKIDGANYFRLKDLGAALGFSVGFDADTKTVLITTVSTAPPPAPVPVAAPTITPEPTPNTSESDVYITDTGSKYHRSSCRYLDESKYEVSLSWAISNGYEPCKVCKP
ncbi:MAG: hypothetical protein LBT88_01840 [Oscillospiraceae bacterium]|jgi:hypothetical protein|nr:hypothetical protein [Oscillospiraceae bacterium]